MMFGEVFLFQPLFCLIVGLCMRNCGGFAGFALLGKHMWIRCNELVGVIIQ